MPRLLARALIPLLAACAFDGGPISAFPIDDRLEPGAANSCRVDVTPPPPNSFPLPGTIKVAPPPTGAYAGHYAVPAKPSVLEAFARQSGQRPSLVYTGHDWVFDESQWETISPRGLWTFNDMLEGDAGISALSLARRLSSQGTVLAFSWAIYCCDILNPMFYLRLKEPNNIYGRIAAGEFDDYIRQEARRIKTFDGPIMLTLVAEFNFQSIFAFGPDGRDWMMDVDDICGEYGDPGWPDGPERIRDANRRVVDLFREEGVRNVTWFMYAASNYMQPGHEDQSMWLHPRYFYPGDEYIDWVGQSVYFGDPEWGRTAEMWGTEISEFADAIEPGYAAWTSVTDKPLFLPEFGAVSDKGDSRARIIAEVFAERLPQLPQIKAVTFAQSELFRAYFALPDLGQRNDEMEAWQRAVTDNPYYTDRVITTRVPN